MKQFVEHVARLTGPAATLAAALAAVYPFTGAFAQVVPPPSSATSASSASSAAASQDGAPAKDAPLPSVVVTGSRISRVNSEGPSPITVIKSEDLDRLGYKNVSDALSSLTENTGFTQGEDFGNTFTPAANAISLRGLGPNHTLVLVNGRRVADYPTAYEGSVNFVNIANIPSSRCSAAAPRRCTAPTRSRASSTSCSRSTSMASP